MISNNSYKKIILTNKFSYKIKNYLRLSIHQLESHGLFKASNWALEQIIGMDHQLDDDPSLNQFKETYQSSITNEYENISMSNIDYLLLAKSFISNKEYQRCFHLLSNIPSLQSNNLCIFLIAYAQYMSGEKLKDQKILEMNNVLTDKTLKDKSNLNNNDTNKKQNSNTTIPTETERNYIAKNSQLSSIYNTLLDHYRKGIMKNDSFLLYIFAIVTRDLHRSEGMSLEDIFQNIKLEGTKEIEECIYKGYAARKLMLESLHVNPWNWSCWLELSELCIAEKQPIPQLEDIINFKSNMHINSGSTTQTTQNECYVDWDCAKIMYACFLIHTYLEKHDGEIAMQMLQSTQTILPNSITILTQIGLAQYTLRLYDEAEESFRTVRTLDPYRLVSIDTYSNILYVKEKSAGNYYSLKGQHDRAVIYFQRALKLNPRYLSAWTLMGHEYMELRNTAAAVQCYRNAVHISEVDYRAWYGLGQTYEMLHLYQYANYYYRKAATLRPDDARMWSAVGNCLLKLAPSNIGSSIGSRLRSEAIRSFERAVSCGDKEGIATRDLARLCREEGDTEKTAEYFLIFLQTRNTFDEVSVGDIVNDSFNFNNMPIDGDQAEALLFMAYYYKSKEAFSNAEVFCNRIIGFAGTESEEARAILRDIRSYTQQLQSYKDSPCIDTKRYTDLSLRISTNTKSNYNNNSNGSSMIYDNSINNQDIDGIIYNETPPQRQRRISGLHPTREVLQQYTDSFEDITPSQSLQIQYRSLRLGSTAEDDIVNQDNEHKI